MGKADAKRAAREIMLSGYQHHSHQTGRMMIDAIFAGRQRLEIMDGLNLGTYADVLAPTRLRAARNGLICLITIVSRIAIENGVENEFAFALSDYYVNAVELQESEEELEALMREIIDHYLELVREAQQQTYSLAVMRAIRYIHLHIYDGCRVAGVAAHVGLNAQYFAVLFKKEVGLSPSRYIAQKKLEEARYLLHQTHMSITEVAEALGYCSPSHFIRAFKKQYGETPKRSLAVQG